MPQEKRRLKRRLPRKILLRRLISSVILLAILALVVLVVLAGKTMFGLFSSQNSVQSASEADTEQSVEIPNCTAADLDVTLEANSVVLSSGSSVEITVTVENQGEEACWMSTSSLQVVVLTEADTSSQTADSTNLLSSQEEIIWPGTECVGDWERPLLLSSGTPWSDGITWDGKVYDECEVSQVSTAGTQSDEVASAGTYIVSAYFADKQVGQQLTLVVQ